MTVAKEDLVDAVHGILTESRGTLFLRHDNGPKHRRELARMFVDELVWPAVNMTPSENGETNG